MLTCTICPDLSSTQKAKSPKQKTNTSNNNLDGKMKGTENENAIGN